jgi:hypothetical protein
LVCNLQITLFLFSKRKETLYSLRISLVPNLIEESGKRYLKKIEHSNFRNSIWNLKV